LHRQSLGMYNCWNTHLRHGMAAMIATRARNRRSVPAAAFLIGGYMRKSLILMVLTLAACGQSSGTRAVTGGLLGAGGGAAVGSATGLGAGTGALIGGAGGAGAGYLTGHH
jgi:hypothetical protein